MNVSSGIDRKELGRRGENLAADFFIRQGFSVIARNWRCPEGELDLVVQNGDDVRAIEVKTRSRIIPGAGPEEVVGDAKLDCLWEAIARFAEQHPEFPEDVIHLDVLTVILPPDGAPEFRWLKDFE